MLSIDYFELNIKSFKTDDSYAIYKKLQIALNKLGTDKKRISDQDT